MGERVRTVRRAATTIWALVTGLLLLLAILVTLIGIYLGQHATQQQNKCRTAAAAQLESANISREDALADLAETNGRLFDASFRRDTAAIATEAAKLPALSDRIHGATDAIHAANEQRLASVEHCGH